MESIETSVAPAPSETINAGRAQQIIVLNEKKRDAYPRAFLTMLFLSFDLNDLKSGVRNRLLNPFVGHALALLRRYRHDLLIEVDRDLLDLLLRRKGLFDPLSAK